MTDITVLVEWKLPQLPRKNYSLTIPANTRVSDFLQRSNLGVDNNEVLVIINGHSARLDDLILPNSKIILLPILCGG